MHDEKMPGKAQLRAQWLEAAPNWIGRMRSGGDSSREGLLDDWMLDAVADVAGKDVIDLGCGEGRFCRMLAQRGARVTGVDACEPFIREADARRVADESYGLGDMEDLRDIKSEHFDLAVAYLTLVDVADYRAAIREAFRVLRPGGRFIICNLAPMVTAGNMWVRYGDGTKLHFRLDNYSDESPRPLPLCGTVLSNFHRMLSSYVNAFIETGFVIEGIREPTPNEAQLAREPSNEDILRVPLFIIYLLRKP